MNCFSSFPASSLASSETLIFSQCTLPLLLVGDGAPGGDKHTSSACRPPPPCAATPPVPQSSRRGSLFQNTLAGHPTKSPPPTPTTTALLSASSPASSLQEAQTPRHAPPLQKPHDRAAPPNLHTAPLDSLSLTSNSGQTAANPLPPLAPEVCHPLGCRHTQRLPSPSHERRPCPNALANLPRQRPPLPPPLCCRQALPSPYTVGGLTRYRLLLLLHIDPMLSTGGYFVHAALTLSLSAPYGGADMRLAPKMANPSSPSSPSTDPARRLDPRRAPSSLEPHDRGDRAFSQSRSSRSFAVRPPAPRSLPRRSSSPSPCVGPSPGDSTRSSPLT